MSYNLRIIQEYFQPKIGRKIRIFSLGWKNNILLKKKSVQGLEKSCLVSPEKQTFLPGKITLSDSLVARMRVNCFFFFFLDDFFATCKLT